MCAAAAATKMAFPDGDGDGGARRRQERHVVAHDNVKRGATTRATMAALMATTMSLPAHDSAGEHMASLGSGGATTVPEGRVCGRTTAGEKSYKMGPAGEPVRERGGAQRARFQI